jgi:putative Ca2+/H+ antiporter (TMEM165/GDT1 family)
MNMRLFATVIGTVFLAEIGDKTQLATLLYASEARNSKLTVFLASSCALVLASAVGVLAGSGLSQLVNASTLSRLAGIGFIAIGIWTLLRA